MSRHDIICPDCDTAWPPGTVVCMKCGEILVGDIEPDRSKVIDAPGQDQALVPAAKPQLPVRKTGQAVLLVIQHNQEKIPEDQAYTLHIPHKDGPIIIGRPDYTNIPPLVPDINLEVVQAVCLLGVDGPIMSRSHVALYSDDNGGFRLRAGAGAQTWIRNSGSSAHRVLGPGREKTLRPRDVISFGPPDGLHFRLRILF